MSFHKSLALGTLSFLALASIVIPNEAVAGAIAALRDGTSIILIDTETNKVTGSVQLTGSAKLVGMDVRPADGKLYGVTGDGSIVVVDPKTGKWDRKSQLSEKLPAGATYSVDFNPAADRLRILSSTGLSLRVNVEDGKAIIDGMLKYAEGDPNKGKAPRVTAAAYTNSYAGTKETALYDIDAATGMLVKQAPPNEGIISAVGGVGIKLDGPIAFDIWSDGKGANVGWLLADGKLHTVDLTTGKARAIAPVAGLTGAVTDMAILPGM